MDDEFEDVLTAVGPRLRALRVAAGTTLNQLSETTGISVSTLSRLESGLRRPTLELLLPLAKAYGVPLDELVGAPETGDPRVHLRPLKRNGRTIIPLTRRLGGIQAYKMIIPQEPIGELRVHEGYDWLYVMSGRLRLMLADKEVVLTPGEAAEFDTHVPHAFTSADPRPVEILTLFGSQGERMHVRARPATSS
ncbi:helix-turn-helix domain-containing protein [Nonomuraea sediminis]|uniref:helix-turn-helix domain-containing protein n=1 Tax=Nonomuraea sediminis TaxID=2835864 RepID=UPI001BDBED96|nr:XRE family transcriptional regulator [Nonomuraea sediminis]